MSIVSLSFTDAAASFAAVSVVSVLYVISKAVYRVYFHPLKHIPGPRLAAATNLYGASYDLVHKDSLCKQVARLHETYGPVVRISPNEVHVNDLESYRKIFKVGSDYHKPWRFYNSNAIGGSLLNILETKAAKQRRQAYTPYFSQAAIENIVPRIHTKINNFIAKLAKASATGTPVNLTRAFRCLTADVIVDHAFAEEFGALDTEDFKHPIIEAGDKLIVFAQWGLYFRKTFCALEEIARRLPLCILAFIAPEMIAIAGFEKSCKDRVRRIKSRHEFGGAKARATIFDNVLGTEQHAGLSDAVLEAEAALMLIAGMDTTANALVTGTYGVLSDPAIRDKLVAELCSAIPDEQQAGWLTAAQARALPYLNAVAKESLRLSYGAPGRIPRVVPAGGAWLAGTFVPAGAIVSHSNYVYHTDSTVFPDPFTFRPERWLVPDATELERYQLAFSRGSRMCLGIHLANTELLLTFARLFREVCMSLWDTKPNDMEWRDYSVVLFRGHLKVTVPSRCA